MKKGTFIETLSTKENSQESKLAENVKRMCFHGIYIFKEQQLLLFQTYPFQSKEINYSYVF